MLLAAAGAGKRVAGIRIGCGAVGGMRGVATVWTGVFGPKVVLPGAGTAGGNGTGGAGGGAQMLTCTLTIELFVATKS